MSGSANPSSSPDVLRRNQAAHEEYTAAAAEYNAQAEAYNQAKRLVEDARKLEGQAHDELSESMKTATANINAGGLVYGFTTKATAYTAIAESGRATQAAAAERFARTADLFTRASLGDIANVTPAQAKFMKEVAEQAGANRDQALKRAKQFENFVNKVPAGVRKTIASHYGRGDPRYQRSRHRAIPKASNVGKVFKNLPYVGSGLVVYNEVVGAVSGEQSWHKAAADSAGQLGGAAVGMTGLGTLGLSVGGPPGMLIGGFVGGVAGGIGGQDVVDIVYGVDDGIG